MTAPNNILTLPICYDVARHRMRNDRNPHTAFDAAQELLESPDWLDRHEAELVIKAIIARWDYEADLEKQRIAARKEKQKSLIRNLSLALLVTAICWLGVKGWAKAEADLAQFEVFIGLEG